jgi:hypothetical protein
MKYILQVDFPYNGPFGENMTNAMTDLAKDISNESGLIWKIWTENQEENIAGGIYLFDNLNDAQRYLDKHTKRLQSFGISDITGKIFNINEELSSINNFNI